MFGTHSILSVAQPRIAHTRTSHVMHGCSAIRDQNGISVNEENTTRSYISNLVPVMTNETEPRTRRFYVDLSPEQEKGSGPASVQPCCGGWLPDGMGGMPAPAAVRARPDQRAAGRRLKAKGRRWSAESMPPTRPEGCGGCEAMLGAGMRADPS